MVGVGAVVLDGERVLLVRRGYEPMKGEWSLPGGKLELGETLCEAVVREVSEETGMTVEPGAVIEVLDRIVRGQDGTVRFHYVLVDFLCAVTAGRLQSASDAQDVRWVARSELSGIGVADFTLTVIEKAFEQAGNIV